MTLDEIDERVEQWHADDTLTMPLQEYLGMTRKEYTAWVVLGKVPGERTTSRNWREGQFMGRAWGKAVRHYAPLVSHRPSSDWARVFRRSQLARQEAHRTGVPLRITRMADQQGAS